MSKISIALTDDEKLFRKGMAMILNDYDADIVMQASNGLELIDQIKTAENIPDVILLDLQMPELDGIETTKRLKAEYPDLKIIILTTHYSKAFIINMIEYGASAYLAKDAEPDEVWNTIKEVHEKGFSYDEKVMKAIRENMVAGYPNKQVSFGQVKLTNRELEILMLICEEKTTNEIAVQLFISPRTVEGHRNNLLDKTGAKNTAGLVLYAVKNKIVDPGIWKNW